MTAPVTTPTPVPVAPTNTKAVLSLVFAFLFWPASIVLGHMARKEIRRTGESGRGYATAGLVLSYMGLAGFLLIVIAGTASVSSATAHSAPSFSTYNLAPTSTVTPSAGPLAEIPDGGPYLIGAGSGEIAPGVYRTAGPNNSLGCYWERAANGGAVTDNDITKGAATITISSTDGSFKTSGCQPWTKIK